MSDDPIYLVPNDGPAYDWSSDSYDKGTDLLASSGKVREIENGMWAVQGSRSYVVRRQGPWLVCTCPNGQALGGNAKCYHTAAVHQILEDRMTYRADGTWA